MIISFKFFDKENWSLHATYLTALILLIFKMGFKSINSLKILVFSSIISMITPDTQLLTKLIFVFFLCLLLWNKNEFFIGTLLAIVSVSITHFIPIDNKLNKLSNKNFLIKYSNIFLIALWFVFISYKIFNIIF